MSIATDNLLRCFPNPNLDPHAMFLFAEVQHRCGWRHDPWRRRVELHSVYVRVASPPCQLLTNWQISMHGATFTWKVLGSWPFTRGLTLKDNLASHITIIVYCFTVVWVNVFLNCDQRFGLFPLQGTSYIRVSLGRLIFSLPLGLYRRRVGQMEVKCFSFLKKPSYQFIIMMILV